MQMENFENIRLPWRDWKIVKDLGGGTYGRVYGTDPCECFPQKRKGHRGTTGYKESKFIRNDKRAEKSIFLRPLWYYFLLFFEGIFFDMSWALCYTKTVYLCLQIRGCYDTFRGKKIGQKRI